MKLNIEITNDLEIFLTKYNYNGSKQSKYINVDDLKALVDVVYKNGNHSEKFISSGLLESSNNFKVIAYSSTKDSLKKIITVLCTNCLHDISYSSDSRDVEVFKNKMLPNCIFKFCITGNLISNAYVYCVKDKILTNKTKLYKFPLGNVPNGSICWGGIRFGEVKDLSNLRRIAGMFFTSPFLNHSYGNTIKDKSISQLSLIRDYMNDEYFNEDLLMEVNIKLEDFIKK